LETNAGGVEGHKHLVRRDIKQNPILLSGKSKNWFKLTVAIGSLYFSFPFPKNINPHSYAIQPPL
jgi:hypothetical protein